MDEEKQYDPNRMKAEMEHPVDEGCTAKEHSGKVVGFTVELKSLWELIRGKRKWGWR